MTSGENDTLTGHESRYFKAAVSRMIWYLVKIRDEILVERDLRFMSTEASGYKRSILRPESSLQRLEIPSKSHYTRSLGKLRRSQRLFSCGVRRILCVLSQTCCVEEVEEFV